MSSHPLQSDHREARPLITRSSSNLHKIEEDWGTLNSGLKLYLCQALDYNSTSG